MINSSSKIEYSVCIIIFLVFNNLLLIFIFIKEYIYKIFEWYVYNGDIVLFLYIEYYCYYVNDYLIKII